MQSKKIYIFIIILTLLTSIFFAGLWYKSDGQLDQARAELELTTKELSAATRYNKEIEARLSSVGEGIEELGKLSAEGADTIQECIFLVREIREKVQVLENSYNSLYID